MQIIFYFKYYRCVFNWLSVQKHYQNLVFEVLAIHQQLQMQFTFLFLPILTITQYFLFFVSVIVFIFVFFQTTPLIKTVYYFYKNNTMTLFLFLIYQQCSIITPLQMKKVSQKQSNKLCLIPQRQKCSLVIGQLFEPNSRQKQSKSKITLIGFQKKTSKSCFKKMNFNSLQNQIKKKYQQRRIISCSGNQSLGNASSNFQIDKKAKKSLSLSSVNKKNNNRNTSELGKYNKDSLFTNSIYIKAKKYQNSSYFLQNIKKIQYLIKLTEVYEFDKKKVSLDRHKIQSSELQNINHEFNKNYLNAIKFLTKEKFQNKKV